MRIVHWLALLNVFIVATTNIIFASQIHLRFASTISNKRELMTEDWSGHWVCVDIWYKTPIDTYTNSQNKKTTDF